MSATRLLRQKPKAPGFGKKTGQVKQVVEQVSTQSLVFGEAVGCIGGSELSEKFIAGHPIDICFSCGINKVDKKSNGTNYTLPGKNLMSIEGLDGKVYQVYPQFSVCEECYFS